MERMLASGSGKNEVVEFGKEPRCRSSINPEGVTVRSQQRIQGSRIPIGSVAIPHAIPVCGVKTLLPDILAVVHASPGKGKTGVLSWTQTSPAPEESVIHSLITG